MLDSAKSAQLLDAQLKLDPQGVKDKLAARFAVIGSSAPVPDLERVLDRDQDGVVDKDDNCPTVPNPIQTDSNGALCANVA